jgi:hypothetical protein
MMIGFNRTAVEHLELKNELSSHKVQIRLEPSSLDIGRRNECLYTERPSSYQIKSAT